MSLERILIDTSYVQALLDPRDQRHSAAVAIKGRVRFAREVVITDAVLIEVANSLCSLSREAAVAFIRSCQQTANVKIVAMSESLFEDSLRLFATRSDKTWSLTDCISFVVMQREGLLLAATADRHFIQAGYKAIMLDD